MRRNLSVNLVLSGGGIRGIAYSGAFSSAEKHGVFFRNIGGVSAGSIAGSLAAAGYKAKEITYLLETCNFGDFKKTEISKRVPAVMKLYDYSRFSRNSPEELINRFLQVPSFAPFLDNQLLDFEYRGIFSNIILYSKEGCLYDGDALEEWVHNCLKRKDIYTFGDLKTGYKDKINPNGYKMRMTAVDADRKKIIVLPDDLAYYGYDPDKFPVAKAVRMSCSVPFAFKPVELKTKIEGKNYKYHIIDGGVLDNFPSWIVGNTTRYPAIGFRLSGGPKKLLSLDTPLSIYKNLLASVHNIGLPKEKVLPDYIEDIDCSTVGFLDMDIDETEKKILVNNGKAAGNKLFKSIVKKHSRWSLLKIAR